MPTAADIMERIRRMAKERTTISGYVVSIDVFVPCDPNKPFGMVEVVQRGGEAQAAFLATLFPDGLVQGSEIERPEPQWEGRRRPAQGEIEIPKAPSERE